MSTYMSLPSLTPRPLNSNIILSIKPSQEDFQIVQKRGVDGDRRLRHFVIDRNPPNVAVSVAI